VLQPPTWRTRSPYLYSLESGWPSYTPRHRVPILIAWYFDIRDKRVSSVLTRSFRTLKLHCIFSLRIDLSGARPETGFPRVVVLHLTERKLVPNDERQKIGEKHRKWAANYKLLLFKLLHQNSRPRAKEIPDAHKLAGDLKYVLCSIILITLKACLRTYSTHKFHMR